LAVVVGMKINDHAKPTQLNAKNKIKYKPAVSVIRVNISY